VPICSQLWYKQRTKCYKRATQLIVVLSWLAASTCTACNLQQTTTDTSLQHTGNYSLPPHCDEQFSFSISFSLSLVFCCYQQVYDIFNMLCLGMILQVRGRDGMSTLQVRLDTHSLTYLPGWLPVAVPAVFIFLSVLLLWLSLPNCRGFPLTSQSLASSQLLMQTPRLGIQ